MPEGSMPLFKSDGSVRDGKKQEEEIGGDTVSQSIQDM